MSLFNSFALEVTRYDSVSIVKGRHISGSDTTSTINITASAQPLTGKEMETLPENRRNTSAYKVFTETELQTSNDATGLKPDRLTLFGKLCEIIQVQAWQNGLINHYECIASEIDDKP